MRTYFKTKGPPPDGGDWSSDEAKADFWNKYILVVWDRFIGRFGTGVASNAPVFVKTSQIPQNQMQIRIHKIDTFIDALSGVV